MHVFSLIPEIAAVFSWTGYIATYATKLLDLLDVIVLI